MSTSSQRLVEHARQSGDDDGHGHLMVSQARTFSETNQAIYGPNSVDYILDNSAVSITTSKAGSRSAVYSVSRRDEHTTSVTMSLARFT